MRNDSQRITDIHIMTLSWKWLTHIWWWLTHIWEWLTHIREWLTHIWEWLTDISEWLTHIWEWLTHIWVWFTHTWEWLTHIWEWLTHIWEWLTHIWEWLTHLWEWLTENYWHTYYDLVVRMAHTHMRMAHTHMGMPHRELLTYILWPCRGNGSHTYGNDSHTYGNDSQRITDIHIMTLSWKWLTHIWEWLTHLWEWLTENYWHTYYDLVVKMAHTHMGMTHTLMRMTDREWLIHIWRPYRVITNESSRTQWVYSKLSLPFQSNWSLLNGTWHERRREISRTSHHELSESIRSSASHFNLIGLFSMERGMRDVEKYLQIWGGFG